jgi:hypothetical protein
MKRPVALAVAVLLVVGGSMLLAREARGAAPGKKPAVAQAPLQGTVAAVDAKKNTLAIVSKMVMKPVKGKMYEHKMRETVSVKAQTQIQFRGKTIKLSEIKKGSTVRVTAQKVRAQLVASRIEVLRGPGVSAKPAPVKPKPKTAR